MSQPTEYFNKVNFSPSTPPRVPPKTNVRAPALHRLSETDSVEEDESVDPIPGPRFRGISDESPVSPYTILDQEPGLPIPSAFDLDRTAGTERKGSGSSAATLSSQKSFPHLTRGKSLPYDDDEPLPFVVKGDKHKRILGIDQNTPPIKRPPQKMEGSKSSSGGVRKKRSHPELDRATSPLPTPDVVPFLYQDIEVCSLC